MDDTEDRERRRKLMVRGFGWFLCLGVWTVALLTTYPAEIGKEFAPSGSFFPAAKILHVVAYAFLTVFLSWLPLGAGAGCCWPCCRCTPPALSTCSNSSPFAPAK